MVAPAVSARRSSSRRCSSSIRRAPARLIGAPTSSARSAGGVTVIRSRVMQASAQRIREFIVEKVPVVVKGKVWLPIGVSTVRSPSTVYFTAPVCMSWRAAAPTPA